MSSVLLAAAQADPTRAVAFALLHAVLDRRRPLEEALDAQGGVEARDRAAGHRLAATTLRRLGTLDAVLEPLLRKQPPQPVRHVLRLGAAGLLLLDSPAHAAVSTAVALCRSLGLDAFAGLVNAVLRRVAADGPALLEGLDGPRLDTPPWLWAAWSRYWGEATRAIVTAHTAEAPLDITLAPGAMPPPGGTALPTGSLRFPPGTQVTALPGFAAGAFWVQDAAAALPARLLAARPGERVADLCAAPGGKTAQLAATGAHIVAVERDKTRLARLRENLARLGLTAETVGADAARWHPSLPFDAVLLDAPCSATGTIRRHPDVVHRRRPTDIAALATAQDRLIEAAAALLRPGGRLIYAVCSLQQEEGPDRIAAAVARGRLRHAPFTISELPGLHAAIAPDGTLRTHPALWPEHGGLDGFFVARLERL